MGWAGVYGKPEVGRQHGSIPRYLDAQTARWDALVEGDGVQVLSAMHRQLLASWYVSLWPPNEQHIARVEWALETWIKTNISIFIFSYFKGFIYSPPDINTLTLNWVLFDHLHPLFPYTMSSRGSYVLGAQWDGRGVPLPCGWVC